MRSFGEERGEVECEVMGELLIRDYGVHIGRVTESPTRKSCLQFILMPAAALLLVAVFLFPPVRGHSISKHQQSKSDLIHITTAVKAYEAEYGKYPHMSEVTLASGLKGNRELMRCLTGTDTLRNPRRILFFEGRAAERISGWFKRVNGGGFDPASGDYLDPWGRSYQVQLDRDYDYKIPNTYIDEPDKQIQSGVIVWSVGKDGVFGRRVDQDKHTRPDDVVSWR